MTAPNIQLLLEETLAGNPATNPVKTGFLSTLTAPDNSLVFPADFQMHPAHGVNTLPDSVLDYVWVKSSLPGGDLRHAGVNECMVEIAIAHGVNDPDKRADQAALHAKRVELVAAYFSLKNFAVTLAALNVFCVANNLGIGFSAWPAEDPEDGDNGESTQLIAKLKYKFICHLT